MYTYIYFNNISILVYSQRISVVWINVKRTRNSLSSVLLLSHQTYW